VVTARRRAASVQYTSLSSRPRLRCCSSCASLSCCGAPTCLARLGGGAAKPPMERGEVSVSGAKQGIDSSSSCAAVDGQIRVTAGRLELRRSGSSCDGVAASMSCEVSCARSGVSSDLGVELEGACASVGGSCASVEESINHCAHPIRSSRSSSGHGPQLNV